MKKFLKQITLFSFLAGAVLILTSAKKQVTVFMIGDSTMANKDIKKGVERGWGMALQGFFTEDIVVDNHALNGRSSRSFILEGHWQKVYDAMKPGDYLVIQFGHNDEKGTIGDKRHTDPGLTFDDNYRMFIRAAQEKGVTPIVMNCVVRRNFYDKSDQKIDDEALRDLKSTGKEVTNSDTLIETHVTKDGNYVTAPINVAKMMRVPYVDANSVTKKLENGLGVEKSRLLHMISVTGSDNTHYTEYGAHEVASLLVDEMAKVCPTLKPFVRHYDYIVSAKGLGNYMTLQAAVDAVPAKGTATICILDGEWKKPAVTNGKKINYVTYSNVKLK